MSPIERIRLAQDFFRFAYSIGTPISVGLILDLPIPGPFAWGQHTLKPEEFNLEPKVMALCGTILDRLAYRLLAMELDSALTQAFSGKDRLNHEDSFIRNASVVLRLVRNAVAHNVFDPVWKIDRNLRNRRITIEGVLTFDSSDLHNQPLNRFDFGGPIALLRLSELIVAKLEHADTV